MPRYKKETLLAMERAKHPEDNIINVDYKITSTLFFKHFVFP